MPRSHHRTPTVLLTLVAVAVAVLVALAGCSADRSEGSATSGDALASPSAEGAPSAGPDGTPAGELLVLDLAEGTYADGVLTVSVVGPVTVFADRPQRLVATRPAGDVVAGWAGRFGDDPPNASLVVGPTVAVVELGAPEVVDGGRLRVGARPLSEVEPPASFGAASLFVDPGEAGSPPPVSVELAYRVPAGGRLAISWQNGTPVLPGPDPGAALLRLTGNGAGASVGDVFFLPRQFAVGGPAGGSAPVDAQASLPYAIADGGRKVVGTAELSPGTTATANVAGGPPVTLVDGQSFALVVP